ncbi:hypothetical protein ACA910_008648 [Epithemia clementina (nom. ined.)]
MFPLHSSANHAFVITRGVHGKNRSADSSSLKKSFLGCDEPVSWGCVRLVKCITSSVETCPICLDSFTCARITKCGHSFCLICLIRHVQCSAFQEGPKCPCCSSSVHLVDVKPVDFFTISPPGTDASAQAQEAESSLKASERSNKKHTAKKMRFVKLYRVKGCAAPFIPNPSHPRRSSPYALPSQSDDDAKFCRFSYVEPEMLKDKLNKSMGELKELPTEGDMFEICRGLAIELVASEQQTALIEAGAETEIRERFLNPTSGVYQPHHPNLILTTQIPRFENFHNDNTEHTSSEDIETPSSPHSTTQKSTTTAKGRTLSVGSENSHSAGMRYRSSSVGSDNSYMTPDHVVAPASPKQRRSDDRSWTPGSLYLGFEENVFFQSEDGQLCFLCGFNLQCLRAEFSTNLPGQIPTFGEHPESGTQSEFSSSQVHNQQQLAPRRSEPLPDSVQGNVIEVEHVILTRQVRQRMRFLSHLPLGTPVSFVEIGLGNVLSHQTKKAFAKEFYKRRNARDRRSRAEKRADDHARKQEEQRIEDYRAQIPLVNRNFRSEAIDITSDAFGPTLCASPPSAIRNAVATNSPAPSSPAQSFSAIARRAARESPQTNSRNLFTNDDFPALGLGGNFPPLGSTPISSTLSSPRWSTNKKIKGLGTQKTTENVVQRQSPLSGFGRGSS